jgi:hypothetical protein
MFPGLCRKHQPSHARITMMEKRMSQPNRRKRANRQRRNGDEFPVGDDLLERIRKQQESAYSHIHSDYHCLGWAIGIGIGLTPVAFFLALISTGAGHGSYGFASALFPYPMLYVSFVSHRIGSSAIALALLQYPSYGAVIGYCASRSWRALLIASGILVTLHVAVLLFVYIRDHS